MDQQIEWRAVDELQEHPEAHLVPEMSEPEWADLVDSIQADGVREPLRILADGTVLDGRHRLRAARGLKLERAPCLVIDLKDEAAQIAYMVQAATLRRQLSKSQLAAISVDLASFEEERAAGRARMSAGGRKARHGLARVPDHGRGQYAGLETLSRERLAARVGVSGRLIQAALKLKREAADLHVLVKEGEINIPEAKRRLKERKKKLGEVVVAPPAKRSPKLYVGDAERLDMIDDESSDIVVTSPPFNLGPEAGQVQTKASRAMGDERVAHGIAWRGPDYEVRLPEPEYQAKQIRALNEMFRVAKPGASLFYHHQVRILDNVAIHPLTWLQKTEWKLRQEIVIDRESTHQNNPKMFGPVDERLYWLFKGERPTLPGRSISLPTVWRLPQRGPVSWHPVPFLEEIPRRCLESVGSPGAVVLDPFGGSMVAPRVALEMGMEAIGVEIRSDYVERAAKENGWRVYPHREESATPSPT